MQTPNSGPPQARVIKNYDPVSEPENGYLGVAVGTVVTVQPGSRSPPESRNRFRCDYVFAWLPDQKEKQGWIPVDILDIMCASMADRLCKHFQRHVNNPGYRGCDRRCCHRSHARDATCYEWARGRRCSYGEECKFQHGWPGQQPGHQQQRQEQEQGQGQQAPPHTLQELLTLALIDYARRHPGWMQEGTGPHRRFRALLHPDNALSAIGAVDLERLKKTTSDSVFSNRPSGFRG